MISPNAGQYLNELITEMRLLSETAIECKHTRLLLSKEISKVLSDLQRATSTSSVSRVREHRMEAGGSKFGALFTPQASLNPFSGFSPSVRDSSPLPSPFGLPFATPIKNIRRETQETEGDWQTPCPSKDTDCVLQTKIYIPEAPNKIGGKNVKCNYIGRILGPSGMSARGIERQFDVTLLIRGAGSVRNVASEIMLKGKKGYEHLDEPLHVLLIARRQDKKSCEEALNKAAEYVESLLTPVHDEYKREQLVRYAIINGTYEERPKKKRASTGESNTPLL